jgi:gamma-glutamyltranspeptidase/glutathione hydrolase
MERKNQYIGFGITGALTEPWAHAQFVSNIADFHMNIRLRSLSSFSAPH